jgi:hypothetical protein
MASDQKRELGPLQLDPRCTALPFTSGATPIVLGDGRLMTMEENGARISADDGVTWSEPRRLYEGDGPGIPNDSSVLLRTRDGTLLLVYMDMSTYRWRWDNEAKHAAEAVLNVWSIRSRDGGATWEDRQQILDGYCGALIDIIQMKNGRIVVPVQSMLHDPSRHVLYTYVSNDDGRTWQRSHLIDLGGHGHHDGAMEPTLVELSDGRLWLLIRTNWDRFWDALSEDGGLSWRTMRPSTIDASSSPGFLLRLSSGRLALVWSRLASADGVIPPRKGGDGNLCEEMASWQREELSLSLSEDDGQTWTNPVVVARQKGAGLSYPYAFERRPGELWITTRFRDRIAFRLRGAEFTRS